MVALALLIENATKWWLIFDHVHWLKIDLNAAEIITVRDYKHTKN